MPTQSSPKSLAAAVTAPEVERWRCPAILRVKSFAVAAVAVLVAAVFFPLWLAVPVAVLLGAWGLGLAVLGASVTVDLAVGMLVLRMGLIVRRVRLVDVTAVLVDRVKVSIGRANGGEISFYPWRKGPLDALLGLPEAASDIGHAISKAVTLAQAAQARDEQGAVRAAEAARTPERTRSRLATAWLGGAGLLAIGCALCVRVHWDNNPALTVLGVVIALVLGLSGLLYLMVALWILLTGRAPRFAARP